MPTWMQMGKKLWPKEILSTRACIPQLTSRSLAVRSLISHTVSLPQLPAASLVVAQLADAALATGSSSSRSRQWCVRATETERCNCSRCRPRRPPPPCRLLTRRLLPQEFDMTRVPVTGPISPQLFPPLALGLLSTGLVTRWPAAAVAAGWLARGRERSGEGREQAAVGLCTVAVAWGGNSCYSYALPTRPLTFQHECLQSPAAAHCCTSGSRCSGAACRRRRSWRPPLPPASALARSSCCSGAASTWAEH